MGVAAFVWNRWQLCTGLGGNNHRNTQWAYVVKKATPRWLWHAIDRHTEKVLAYVFGRRKDDVFLGLQKLLEPFGITKFYTDGWGLMSVISPLKSTRWAKRTRRKSKASISIFGRGSSG